MEPGTCQIRALLTELNALLFTVPTVVFGVGGGRLDSGIAKLKLS